MAKSVSEKSTSQQLGDFNTSEDRRLLWKVDLRLIPILTLLYILSFLDRTNIGNARILGLATDLHLSPSAYNTSLALYFVAYVLFEVPSNIILKRFDPQLWLPTLTWLWGIVSLCQGVVTNQAGLFGIRFLLGVTEAGLFPGVIYVFSVYYRRRERSWRVAIFFGGAALAGAFGGILAYAIGKMDGIGGRKGWEWIFIIEGILTVVIALAAYFLVPTWSHKAKFLTEMERKRLLARLKADSDAGDQEQFDWFYVRQAFTDHLVWGYAFLFHGFAFVLYSLSLFMPTIIAGLGFQSWQAQLMTIPPNTLAAISIWTTVWISAKYNRRALFIILSAVVAIIGYIILLATTTPGSQYVGVHFAAAGVYTGNALLLSVLIYRPEFSGHRYRKPHIIAIGYILFSAVVATYLWWWMSRENGRRDQLQALSEGDNPRIDDSLEEQQRLGDRRVDYRYVI
ncbi:hypothetical protein AX16_007990 [Volvariella volvacea WC 439]|nr:hypothetical protein AX16_007990 [Volvariella volvacea WC 439]